MSFLIVPNEVQSHQATIWIAAIDQTFDPAKTVLDYGSNSLPLPGGWKDFATDDGERTIRYQRVVLTNLSPRTAYTLVLRVGGHLQADGVVTTLPERLPAKPERAFTVLLGSCFYAREDAVGAVGQTFNQLPHDARPDIKILCGDQVYLDNPFQDFLNPLRGESWLKARSFKTYADTWSQMTSAGGFHRLLKNNANYFSSDDHEFWNNAPDRGFNVPLLAVSDSQRKRWFKIARELYQIFQTDPPTHPRPPLTFDVAPLSFCIAETRFFRERARGNLMPPADLQAIGTWLRNLNGPGCLVLGQPLFSKQAGLMGNFKDWGLPDFTEQYTQLIQHLRAAKHSVVILTGDVHFGRISIATLRPELGTKLIEVISSPMQLVPKGGGDYEEAPHVFGSITSEPEFSLKHNHFLTLEFLAPSAQRAEMAVKFWPIIKSGLQLQGKTIGKSFELI